MDNVWIGGNGPADSHVLKFTKDGTFLMQIGIPGARQTAAEDGQPFFAPDSNSMNSYGRVAKIGIHPEANEAYFADGYGTRPDHSRARRRQLCPTGPPVCDSGPCARSPSASQTPAQSD